MRRHCLLPLALISLCLTPAALCLCSGASNQLQDSDRYLELLRTKNPEDVTTEELYQVSDWVIIGIVDSIEVKSSEFEGSLAPQPTAITFVRIRPDAWDGRMKIGEPPAEIIVRIPGEKQCLETGTEQIGGTPLFERDQAVILFLRRIEGTGYYYPAFGARGVFVIDDAKIERQVYTQREIYPDDYYISIKDGQVYNQYLSRKFGAQYWSRSFHDFKRELLELSRRWAQNHESFLIGKRVDEITVQELVESSDYIIRGRVEAIEVRLERWEERPEAPLEPSTFVTIRPTEWIKSPREENSEHQEQIQIRIRGGTVELPGGLGYGVIPFSGKPRFEVNQNVIVFLRKPKGYRYFRLTFSARSQYVVEDGQVYNMGLGKGTWSAPVDSFVAELKRVVQEETY